MTSLILATYDAWFSDISIRWNMKEYVDVLDIGNLEEKLSKYL
jgi:hypothetical protein